MKISGGLFPRRLLIRTLSPPLSRRESAASPTLGERSSSAVVALGGGHESDCFRRRRRCNESRDDWSCKIRRERKRGRKETTSGAARRTGVRTAGINEFIGRSFNFLAHGQAGEIAAFETPFPINRFNNSAAYIHARTHARIRAHTYRHLSSPSPPASSCTFRRAASTRGGDNNFEN